MSPPAGVFPPTYLRVPFELAGTAAARALPDPPGVTWRGVDDCQLLDLLTRTLQVSIDPRDEAEVRRAGAPMAAARLIEDARSGGVYESESGWWWILEVDGAGAGFVLPVVFTGCARGAADEGTIYHLGVVPEQRGRGLGALLLGRATDTLLNHGVWQISCDTAAGNTPMIRLFEQQGWTRRPEIEVVARGRPVGS